MIKLKKLLAGVVLATMVNNGTADTTHIEYFFDTDPGFGNGLTAPITTTGGTHKFDVDTKTLEEGLHLLGVRVQDNTGVWSPTQTLPVFIINVKGSSVTRTEHFFDSDPGYSNGLTAPITTTGGTHKFDVDTKTLEEGLHLLGVRVQDNVGVWSPTQTLPVFIINVKSSSVTRAEYFFDTDPGYGNAAQVPSVTAGENSFSIPCNEVSGGAHVLSIRTQDDKGVWSYVQSRPLYVYPDVGFVVTDIEYFFDNNDPGMGKAHQVSVPAQSQATVMNFQFDVSLDDLTTAGTHQLNVRAKGSNGQWGTVSSEPFELQIKDGIASVSFNYGFSAQAENAVCTLTKNDDNQLGNSKVEIFTTSGQLVSTAVWNAQDKSVKLPIRSNRGTILIVRVTETEGNKYAVKRIVVR